MILEISVDPSRKLAIKQGQKVDFQTILYIMTETEEQRIEIASELSISPKHILSHLNKSVGDMVQSGEIIAQTKSLFQTRHVVSSLQGIIKEIDHIEGVVLIESVREEVPEYCWFAGEIVGIEKKKVKVHIGKHHSFAAKTVHADFGGILWYPTLHEDIPEHPVGLAERFSDYEIAKLTALGAHGLLSLEEYTQKTDLPSALFKLKNDYQKVLELHFPYCLVQKEHSTIMCYSVII